MKKSIILSAGVEKLYSSTILIPTVLIDKTGNTFTIGLIFLKRLCALSFKLVEK